MTTTNENATTHTNDDPTIRHETHDGVTFTVKETRLGRGNDLLIEVYVVPTRPRRGGLIDGEVRRETYGGLPRVKINTPSFRGDAADALLFAALLTFLHKQAKRLADA